MGGRAGIVDVPRQRLVRHLCSSHARRVEASCVSFQTIAHGAESGPGEIDFHALLRNSCERGEPVLRLAALAEAWVRRLGGR